MSENNFKSGKINITVDSSLNGGFKDYIVWYIGKCAYCGKTYQRFRGEWDYKQGKNRFCSWSCKYRYLERIRQNESKDMD